MDNFSTERLLVSNWRKTLSDKDARRALETALSSILTKPVLEHLPSPLQSVQKNGSISSWVNLRDEESDVLLIELKGGKKLLGLLILASDPHTSERLTIHIGYLLGEQFWGQGIASELLIGLTSHANDNGPKRLIGGVSKDNPASARVLQKAGFTLALEISTLESDMYVHDIG